MRRFIVIFLVFLFPIQLFAGSLDRQASTHPGAADHLTLSEAASDGADGATASGIPAPEGVTDGADINDSVGPYSQFPQAAHCGSCATLRYAPPSQPLLFSPVIKPPPRV